MLQKKIPMGLMVYEALTKMLDKDCSVCTEIIDMHNIRFNEDIRVKVSNLGGFDAEHMKNFLFSMLWKMIKNI